MTESTSDVKDMVKPRADPRSWLRDRLLHECEAMAAQALSSGVKVPASAVRALAVTMAQAVPGEAKVTAGDGTLEPHWPDDGLGQLVLAHNRLVELVAPATPRTIQYLYVRFATAPRVWRPPEQWQGGIDGLLAELAAADAEGKYAF